MRGPDTLGGNLVVSSNGENMARIQADNRTSYHYTFKRHVPIDDVQDTLTLSILGAEHLHGRAKIRLDGWWRLDRQRRVCMIDASTPVGADIAKLFNGYLSREFGESAFRVMSANGGSNRCRG